MDAAYKECMQTIEKTSRRSGLSRFLDSHRPCGDGFSTSGRNGRLLVECNGCGTGYLLMSRRLHDDAGTVDALRGLGNGAASPLIDGTRRLPPPGPWSPRRLKRRTLRHQLDRSVVDPIAGRLSRLRRGTSVIGAIALLGALALLTLTLAGRAGEPNAAESLGGPDVVVAQPPQQAATHAPVANPKQAHRNRLRRQRHPGARSQSH